MGNLAVRRWSSCCNKRGKEDMGRGGAPIESTLVPTRFMLLTAQAIVTIMLFYTKDQNIYASLGDTYTSSAYTEKDDQMKTMLGFAIVGLFILFVGLVTGVTMFAHQLNVFHISMNANLKKSKAETDDLRHELL